MPSEKGEPLHGWRALIGYAGFPVVLAGGVVVAWVLMDRGFSPLVASVSTVVPAAVLVAILERILPFRKIWHATKRVLFVDLLHSLVSANAVLPLLRATLFALLAAVSVWLEGKWGQGIWPAQWPVALQLVIAVAIADLGAYSGHRFMHVSRFGWRLHAVHHTPLRLDFLAAGRAHPFNAILTISLEHGSLILLGAPPVVLVLFTVYKGINGLLQHSNVDLRTGALGYVLATQQAHRWHHSCELAESNRNFGNTLMLWDHVFGTFAVPRDRVAPAVLGVSDAPIPENYWVHLAVPFTLQRYEQRADPSLESELLPHRAAEASDATL